MRFAALLAIAAVACAAPPPVRPQPLRAPIFARLGCSDCHPVSALRIRAVHDVGPDLTFAYGDVMNRYGMTLEAFLANPTGVMRLMLGAHLQMTAADRDSVVAILKALHVQQRAAAGTP